ncbi:MAG: ribosome-associated translation inhibitor RaiA [Parcubacteria group bacterium]|nr:ribosome-associated translation inhibitor RaiA [Parcubacteria group bacterium]
MFLKIEPKNIKLDDALIVWVEKKIAGLEKFLKKIDPAAVEARVEIGKSSKHHLKGLVWYAEANLKVPGKLLRATNTNKDLRTAVNQVKEELQRQIEKYLGK